MIFAIGIEIEMLIKLYNLINYAIDFSFFLLSTWKIYLKNVYEYVSCELHSNVEFFVC